MIFNPYDIHFVQETAASASNLPWALPQLKDNVVLVGLALVFIVADMLACCNKGVMQHQFSWIANTRNARTFESVVVIFPWIKPLLIVQMFLFCGLTVFCLLDDAPAEHLLSGQPMTWANLALCIAVPFAWFVLQGVLFNWFCYLFDLKDKRTIMNRSYLAAFVIPAPLSMLLFIGLASGWITAQIALVLLVVLFILSQFAFIFSGIKIFYDGFGSLCLIIAYLCTLEIAPLVVIWAKFSTLQV